MTEKDSSIAGRRPPPRRFGRIEAADLKHDERLAELYGEAVSRRWWPNSNKAVLDFWCLAEKALQDDTLGTPGRLFHALVKRKELGRITDGQERRALARMPSEAREQLVAVAMQAREDPSARALEPLIGEEAEAAALGEAAVGFQHSVMMMCFLPQKRLPREQREFVVRHGRAALQVEAGSLANPRKAGEFKRCEVPFGSRARVIVPYINAYAVRHRTREVDLGRSLREFLARIGLTVDGRRGRAVTQQVEAVAAAQFLLGEWLGDRTTTQYGRVADAVSFWIERDANQRTLWEPSMWLSEKYYDVLTERPVFPLTWAT